jgi:methyltransferase (TIGR00027 family)
MDEVSTTALGVARVRAAESERPDRLFEDPWAARFCAAAPELVPVGQRTPMALAFALQAVIRTRFYDDYLLDAGCPQVVVLGAGLDSRAYRLDWPADTDLYEVDLPGVLAFKEKVLGDAEPRCHRVVVPADLAEEWEKPLLAAGFDPERPTAWLAEGLLAYLTPQDAERLLSTVTGLSAPGSRFSSERGDHALRNEVAKTASLNKYATYWKGGLGRPVHEWLDENGWAATSHDLGDVAAGYGRPPSQATTSGFATAIRGA